MRFVILLLFTSSLLGQTLQQNINFMALGDSYTIGASVPTAQRWPNQLMDSLESRGYNIQKNDIIATSGWTTTNLLNNIRLVNPDKDYNLVSVLIGVNNFFQQKPIALYRTELKTLLDTALDLTNNDTNAIFIITIPDYGYTPFGEGNKAQISANTNIYNAIKDSIAAVYKIPVFNITPISRRGLEEPQLVASDNLHPSAVQYSLWVELILNKWFTPTQSQQFKASMKAVYINNTFSFTPDEDGALTIFDTTGRLIHTQTVRRNERVNVFCTSKCIATKVTCKTRRYSALFVQ